MQVRSLQDGRHPGLLILDERWFAPKIYLVGTRDTPGPERRIMPSPNDARMAVMAEQIAAARQLTLAVQELREWAAEVNPTVFSIDPSHPSTWQPGDDVDTDALVEAVVVAAMGAIR